MGDSGALVLGFTLATVSVAGLLKTASTVVLFLPLLVLAVPIIDTSFVVAKRLKYRRPIYSADRSHLHHRFVNIGFSQRRAALVDVGLDGDARCGGARDRLHPVPRGRRVAPRGRRSPSPRSRSPRSPTRSTSSTCSRSSSSPTRGCGAARPTTRPREGRRRSDPGLRGTPDEVRQRVVEVGVQLRDVAVAGEDEPLGRELALEHVADRVEGGVVVSGDDELGERSSSRASRAGCRPPTARARRSASGRPARAPATAATAGRARSRLSAGSRAGRPPGRRWGRSPTSRSRDGRTRRPLDVRAPRACTEARPRSATAAGRPHAPQRAGRSRRRRSGRRDGRPHGSRRRAAPRPRRSRRARPAARAETRDARARRGRSARRARAAARSRSGVRR